MTKYPKMTGMISGDGAMSENYIKSPIAASRPSLTTWVNSKWRWCICTASRNSTRAVFRAYRLIGLIFKDRDRNSEAEAAHRECLNRKPSRTVEREVKLALAEFLIRQLRYPDALAIDRILDLTIEALAKPWDSSLRLKLAELHGEAGQPKIADVWRRAATACAVPPR